MTTENRATLAQVMACCLTAQSHYLNQCSLIISKVEWHSSNCKFTSDTSVTNHWNHLENQVPKIQSKFPRGQWVNNSAPLWLRGSAPVSLESKEYPTRFGLGLIHTSGPEQNDGHFAGDCLRFIETLIICFSIQISFKFVTRVPVDQIHHYSFSRWLTDNWIHKRISIDITRTYWVNFDIANADHQTRITGVG